MSKPPFQVVGTKNSSGGEREISRSDINTVRKGGLTNVRPSEKIEKPSKEITSEKKKKTRVPVLC